MDYDEFLSTTQKWGSKPHRITHCLGARDAWKWVRKGKWTALKGYRCSSSTYNNVINKVNQILIDKLLEGHVIPFPYAMGSLRLVAYPVKFEVVDGKVRADYRTDWKKTLAYWYEDPEARADRKLIKRVQKYNYRLQYSKTHARYRYKSYYDLRINRSLVRLLGKKIDNQKLNALIY